MAKESIQHALGAFDAWLLVMLIQVAMYRFALATMGKASHSLHRKTLAAFPHSPSTFRWRTASLARQRIAVVYAKTVSVAADGSYDEKAHFSDGNFNGADLGIGLMQNARQQLQPHFPFPLDPWQLSAGASILASRNVIVCAPTAAGKTVVGEMALRIALERGTTAIYTTPLKALSNQKFDEMRKVFGVERVGLATGDISIRRGADVTIMTTEVYRNMACRARTRVPSLSNGLKTNGILIDPIELEAGWPSNNDEYANLSSNSIVVLDEFHYMGEKRRGSTWEECVIFNPPHTQIVGLSATLPNAHQLASWMENVTGRDSVLIEANDRRPVPLRYYFASKRNFCPLFRDKEAGPGAPHGLLGLRGEGLAPKTKTTKMKKKGTSADNHSRPRSVDESLFPRGLDLHPALQIAAERRLARIDRRVRQIIQRECYDDYKGYGGGPRISAREQRKMKESMLKAEMRKSIPSIAVLLRKLQQKDLLPTIFFIFSRKGCDNAAEILCENLKKNAEERANGTRPAAEKKRRKRKVIKGKGKARSRQHSNGRNWDLSEDELAVVQDAKGRNFRVELLDQLLSDEYDSFTDDNSAIKIEDDSFLSEGNTRYYAGIGLLNAKGTKEVASRVAQFNTENPEIAFGDSTVEQLLCGIGSHHAGILPAHKVFVETLFKLELMKVVFATETLAAGINMPARTTVICSMAKRGDLGMELLETHNMLQMAGRAGRRGMDAEGTCVIVATPFEGPDEAIKILTNEIKPIQSQFSPSYALVVNLIERGFGKLDVARDMVEKSFAQWESQQSVIELQLALKALESGVGNLLPEEHFLNTLQVSLEKELMEARDGTLRTGTSQSKLAKLTVMVDVLADGKKLNKISKKYSGTAQILDLEQGTLNHLERELREMDEMESLDLDLPADLFDKDKLELLAAIKAQRQRVIEVEQHVNNDILLAMAKEVSNRMRNEADFSLSRALLAVRMHGEDPVVPEGAPLEPGELNAYIKKVSKNNRRPLLDRTTSIPSDDSGHENWNQMLALIAILEAYGCLVPASDPEESSDAESKKYNVTSGGEHVRSLGMDNSLWQLCALGGAWDMTYETAELDKFHEAFVEFEMDNDELVDKEKDESGDIPKPQKEAETLTSCLCQLRPSEMAGYISSLVVDSPRRSDSSLESFQKLTYSQQQVVQGALLSLERLMEVQRRLGLADAIGKCQLELSACNVVTAWASGCSWNDALAISGDAPGDLVRTLSRALDALRQLGNLPYLPEKALDGTVRVEASGIHPTIRFLCREAAKKMDRYPVRDMLPFDEDDGEELESESESDEEDGGPEED